MAAQAITLHLPPTLYDHFRQRAERAHRSVETEILEAVATSVPREDELSPDLARAIADLPMLDDEALRRAASDHFPETAAERLAKLNLKQQREKLSESERTLLAQLVEGYERVMLVRAEAAWLLNQRGREIGGPATGG